uniref:Rab-GAP TBC domain-containing protein n=1 Tax=Strigamia maritima TaxID=126957 RepID=T1JLH6_STRMM
MASGNYRARLNEFEECIKAEEIDMKKLRTLCFQGIPDEQGMRPLCWKLLLNYLNGNQSLWADHLQKQRQLYNHFVDEMVFTHSSEIDDASPENCCGDHVRII